MNREDMALEISLRRGIELEEVEEVLEEEDLIEIEELIACKRRKKIFTMVGMSVFLVGAAAVLCILDKQEKIDIESTVKKYVDKIIKEKESMIKS